jgi:heat shock 70kDa protein 4
MDAEPTPPPPKTRKVKKQVRKADLPVVGGGLSLDSALKESYKEREGEMTIADKLIADTEDRKNALEEYIYDTRGKLDDIYADYASEEEKTKFRTMLDAAEVPRPLSGTFLIVCRSGFTMKVKMQLKMHILQKWKNFSL